MRLIKCCGSYRSRTYDLLLMRHSANLESVKTYEGTHEMHTLIVGKNISGYSAFD